MNGKKENKIVFFHDRLTDNPESETRPPLFLDRAIKFLTDGGYMFKTQQLIISLSVLIICISITNPSPVLAAEKRDMGGWELGSPYNRYYNAAEMDSFKGRVVKFKEIIPLPGMSPGTAVVVKEAENEEVVVHLCPAFFETPNGIRIKKGDRVKVRGVWAEINGEDVFIASKIKKGDYSFKVRMTKDGRPIWTMSPEEREKERQDD